MCVCVLCAVCCVCAVRVLSVVFECAGRDWGWAQCNGEVLGGVQVSPNSHLRPHPYPLRLRLRRQVELRLMKYYIGYHLAFGAAVLTYQPSVLVSVHSFNPVCVPRTPHRTQPHSGYRWEGGRGGGTVFTPGAGRGGAGWGGAVKPPLAPCASHRAMHSTTPCTRRRCANDPWQRTPQPAFVFACMCACVFVYVRACLGGRGVGAALAPSPLHGAALCKCRPMHGAV